MRNAALLIMLVIAGCASQPHTDDSQTDVQKPQEPVQATLKASPEPSPEPPPEPPVTTQPDRIRQLLNDGFKTLSRRKTKIAIEQYFDKAIALCNDKYKSTDKQVYASRGRKEALFYLSIAAFEKRDAIIIDSTCSEALYLKAYASLDMGRIEIAEQYLLQAIEMSPANSRYLAELGHIHQISRNWEQALRYFNMAEKYASTYTPPVLKLLELSRAKRGIGYTFIEQGKLDAAEAKFRECLTLDSTDKAALNELNYIEKLRRNTQ